MSGDQQAGAAQLAQRNGDTLLRRAARMTPGLLELNPAPGTGDGRAVLAALLRPDQLRQTQKNLWAAACLAGSTLWPATLPDQPLVR